MIIRMVWKCLRHREKAQLGEGHSVRPQKSWDQSLSLIPKPRANAFMAGKTCWEGKLARPWQTHCSDFAVAVEEEEVSILNIKKTKDTCDTF